jgi:glycerate dehydrogenase
MNIVVLDGYTLNPGDLSWEGFEKIGNLIVYDRTVCDDGMEQIVKRAENAEIVITNKTPLSDETIRRLPLLRYIGVLATGYNVVDITAAAQRGITVTNVPAYSTASVAQMAIALLLELCSHVGAHSESVKKGDWCESLDYCYWNHPLVELAGKTMGVIGYGSIGKKTAAIAQAMGMKVVAFTPHPDQTLESPTLKFVACDELFRQSDVIALFCPLFESTRGIINRKSISKMKNGVMILNNSRGPLIEEQDLAEALNSGKVGGAALDVMSAEPIRPDNPLLSAKNCIITPHISWAPIESRKRLMNQAVENLADFLAGRPINIVK